MRSGLELSGNADCRPADPDPPGIGRCGPFGWRENGRGRTAKSYSAERTNTRDLRSAGRELGRKFHLCVLSFRRSSELSGDAHESVITYPPTITQPCGGINYAIQLPKVARSAHGSLRFLLCGSRYQSLVYADRKRPRTGAKNIDEAAPKGDGEQES